VSAFFEPPGERAIVYQIRRTTRIVRSSLAGASPGGTARCPDSERHLLRGRPSALSNREAQVPVPELLVHLVHRFVDAVRVEDELLVLLKRDREVVQRPFEIHALHEPDRAARNLEVGHDRQSVHHGPVFGRQVPRVYDGDLAGLRVEDRRGEGHEDPSGSTRAILRRLHDERLRVGRGRRHGVEHGARHHHDHGRTDPLARHIRHQDRHAAVGSSMTS